MGVLFIPQMQASNICQHLNNKVWKSYAHDLSKAPLKSEGIYAIGFRQLVSPGVEVLYVGRSEDIHRRLQQHKCQKQAIDNFVKEQFALNGGINLCIKWVEVQKSTCLEGKYLNCMSAKLGYWPRFNLQHGNTCKY